MKSVLILIESKAQLGFFSRMIKAFNRLGYTVTVLTTRLSLYLYCRALRIDCRLTAVAMSDGEPFPLSTTGEVLYGIFTPEEAQMYFTSVRECAEKILHGSSVRCIMIWGGGDTVASAAMVHLATQRKIDILYIDRANIPGKIIVDPVGMNFQSSLYKRMSMLDAERKSDESFRRYQEAFQTGALRTSHSGKNINWLSPVDIVQTMITGLPNRRKGKSQDAFNLPVDSAAAELPKKGYCFIPLSHSFEFRKEPQGIGIAEILMQSGSEEAEQRSCSVLVKFHPAEHDQEFIRYVYSLQDHYHFMFTAAPLRSLIEHSAVIVSAHTSVALEAMLMGKKVRHIGRSIFGEMDGQRLKQYVTWYLLDVDVNSTEEIDEKTVQMMIDRTELR